MRLLLAAGAAVDAVDAFGYSPVIYAAKHVLLEPIKFLAEADCALHGFPPRYGRNYFGSLLEESIHTESWPIYELHRPGASKEEAAEIVDTMIRLVAQRRRKLAALARTFLEDHLVSQLQLSHEKVLDYKASLATSMLQGKVEIPESLKELSPLSSTVYHIHHLTTLREARTLWETGFCDMNELDSLGQSCLMKRYIPRSRFNEGLELIEWLVSKGADIHRQQGYAFQWREPTDYKFDYTFPEGNVYRTENPSSTTAVHYLAVRWGSALYHEVQTEEKERLLRHQFRALTETSKGVVQMVLFDPLPDSCNCACSTGGCRAYTMMVKYPIMRAHMYDWNCPKAVIRKAALHITKATADLLDVNLPNLAWLRRDMLRFNTFERLELRHTCCMMGVIEPEELNEEVIAELGDEENRCEIRDEQKEQVQKLEELLVEFEEKFNTLAVPFSQFLDGYWGDRMKEVESEQDPIDWEGLERIGVTVYSESFDSEEVDEVN